MTTTAPQNQKLGDKVADLIKRNLHHSEPNKVSYAAHALLKWRELDDSAQTKRLITLLISQIVPHQTSGLPAKLWVAKELVNYGFLSDGEHETLTEAIPLIFDAMNYEGIDPRSRVAASASLVREGCVVLAKALLSATATGHDEINRIIEEARLDPLPEVRFAVTSESDD